MTPAEARERITRLAHPRAFIALTEESGAGEVVAVKLPAPNARHAPAGCSANLGSVMPIQTGELPSLPGLVRVELGGHAKVAVFSQGRLRELDKSLDELMRLPAAEMLSALETATREIDPAECSLLAPVESQEVWAAGVTYLQSRAGRMEESSSAQMLMRGSMRRSGRNCSSSRQAGAWSAIAEKSVLDRTRRGLFPSRSWPCFQTAEARSWPMHAQTT